jgi:hypothetical protein
MTSGGASCRTFSRLYGEKAGSERGGERGASSFAPPALDTTARVLDNGPHHGTPTPTARCPAASEHRRDPRRARRPWPPARATFAILRIHRGGRQCLRCRHRGLAGGSSLAQLLAERWAHRNIGALPDGSRNATVRRDDGLLCTPARSRDSRARTGARSMTPSTGTCEVCRGGARWPRCCASTSASSTAAAAAARDGAPGHDLLFLLRRAAGDYLFFFRRCLGK